MSKEMISVKEHLNRAITRHIATYGIAKFDIEAAIEEAAWYAESNGGKIVKVAGAKKASPGRSKKKRKYTKKNAAYWAKKG